MDHDRSSPDLRHRKMWRGDGLGCIAPGVDYEHREVAAVAGSAQRPQMLLGVGGIVMAAGGETSSRLALIHPGTAVTIFMNMKAMVTRRQTGKLGRDDQAPGAIGKRHTSQAPGDTSSAD
jgi:hypothetical protein